MRDTLVQAGIPLAAVDLGSRLGRDDSKAHWLRDKRAAAYADLMLAASELLDRVDSNEQQARASGDRYPLHIDSIIAMTNRCAALPPQPSWSLGGASVPPSGTRGCT